jgi:hypothetical protein
MGAHDSDDRDTDVVWAVREIVVVFTVAPSVAVKFTLWSDANAPAVAVNDAVVEPAATLTTEGTLNVAALLEIATTIPVAGAAEPSVIVHDVDPLGFSELDEHVRLLSSVGVGDPEVDTVPPVAETSAPLPVGVAPSALLIAMEVEPAEAARVNETTATTPFGIVLAFIPEATQMEPVDVGEQASDLPAPVSTAPGLTVAVVKFATG